jgi:hypothetical protein
MGGQLLTVDPDELRKCVDVPQPSPPTLASVHFRRTL